MVAIYQNEQAYGRNLPGTIIFSVLLIIHLVLAPRSNNADLCLWGRSR